MESSGGSSHTTQLHRAHQPQPELCPSDPRSHHSDPAGAAHEQQGVGMDSGLGMMVSPGRRTVTVDSVTGPLSAGGGPLTGTFPLGTKLGYDDEERQLLIRPDSLDLYAFLSQPDHEQHPPRIGESGVGTEGALAFHLEPRSGFLTTEHSRQPRPTTTTTIPRPYNAPLPTGLIEHPTTHFGEGQPRASVPALANITPQTQFGLIRSTADQYGHHPNQHPAQHAKRDQRSSSPSSAAQNQNGLRRNDPSYQYPGGSSSSITKDAPLHSPTTARLEQPSQIGIRVAAATPTPTSTSTTAIRLTTNPSHQTPMTHTYSHFNPGNNHQHHQNQNHNYQHHDLSPQSLFELSHLGHHHPPLSHSNPNSYSTNSVPINPTYNSVIDDQVGQPPTTDVNFHVSPSSSLYHSPQTSLHMAYSITQHQQSISPTSQPNEHMTNRSSITLPQPPLPHGPPHSIQEFTKRKDWERILLEDLTDLIMIVDCEEGRIEYMNPRGKRMMLSSGPGREQQDKIVSKIYDLCYGEEDAVKLRQRIESDDSNDWKVYCRMTTIPRELGRFMIFEMM